jgi:hypothetical protein
MNKDYVLFHLTKAEQAIQELIAGIQSNPECEYRNYRVDMEHLYHHINTAWNARDASEAAVDKCSEENFGRWRQFPTDMELLS